MRRAAKVDGNHVAVVAALRQAGISTWSLASLGKGTPDLACGYRGLTCFLEVKDGALCPSHRKLTADEQKFIDGWGGHVAVVTTPEEAVIAVVSHAKEMGRV